MQKKKTKILHITSSLKMGGAERVLYRLVTSLPFDQVVFYFHDGPFVSRIADLGVKVVKIEGCICRYDPVFFWRLLRAVRKENPDLIHALLWAANIAARLCAFVLQKPVITAYHNNVIQDGFVRGLLDRLTVRLSDRHIAVSEQVAQSLQDRSGYVPADRIEVIKNGISLPSDCVKLQKKDLGIPEEAFVIGAVGRFVALKRFDFLLKNAAQCMAKYDHVYVLLVGTGPEEPALRSLALSLGISDKVLFVVNQDALPYYSVMNCFVQCSDNEGISIALLEAMSMELPCIVMGRASAHSVITHNRDGLVCVPGDEQMFAAYIVLLILHEKESHALAQQAALTVRQLFTEQVMIDKYAKVFKRLLEEKF